MFILLSHERRKAESTYIVTVMAYNGAAPSKDGTYHSGCRNTSLIQETHSDRIGSYLTPQSGTSYH